MSILRRSDTKKLFGSVMYVIDNGEITRLIKSTWIISEPQSGMPKSINSQNANTEIAKKVFEYLNSALILEVDVPPVGPQQRQSVVFQFWGGGEYTGWFICLIFYNCAC